MTHWASNREQVSGSSPLVGSYFLPKFENPIKQSSEDRLLQQFTTV